MYCWRPRIQSQQPEQFTHQIPILSPVSGEIFPLSSAATPTVAMRLYGDGVLIKFSSHQIQSPFNGHIVSLPEHMQYIEWRAKNGLRLRLTFIGDVFASHGEGFRRVKKSGDATDAGETVCFMDKNKLKTHLPDMLCSITLLNAAKLAALVTKPSLTSGANRINAAQETLMTAYI